MFGWAFAARMPGAKLVGPPLRRGGSIYAVVDGYLTCMRAADFRVLWRSDTATYAPSNLTSVGDELYAWCRNAGDWVIGAHDRSKGTRTAISPKIALLRAPDEQAWLVVAGRSLLARLGDLHSLADYTAPVPLNGLEFDLPLRYDAQLVPASIPVPRRALPRTANG